MGWLRLKPGARLFVTDEGIPVFDSGGARLLAALDETADSLDRDLTITSGADGRHSGPSDPHRVGRAFDLRSHDLPSTLVEQIVRMVLSRLLTPGQTLTDKDGGLVTPWYYGFLEAAGTPNEHFHFQVRNGVTLPLMRAVSSTAAPPVPAA